LAGLGQEQEQGRLEEIDDGRFDVQVFGTSELFTRDRIATVGECGCPKESGYLKPSSTQMHVGHPTSDPTALIIKYLCCCSRATRPGTGKMPRS
jgi:hypothetical protein